MNGLLILLLLLCPVPTAALDGVLPPPPPPLATVFMTSLGTEEDIEFQRWAAALARTEQVATDFRTLLPTLERLAPGKVLTSIQQGLDRLEGGLQQQDPATAYRAYFQLRQSFLGLLQQFAYPFPPILLVIRHDLGSALQAAVRDNREEVRHELNELDLNYRQALPELTALGIPPQQSVAVMVRIARAREALPDAEHPGELLRVLRELEALLQQQHRQLTGER